jgi:hypothetical protein
VQRKSGGTTPVFGFLSPSIVSKSLIRNSSLAGTVNPFVEPRSRYREMLVHISSRSSVDPEYFNNGDCNYPQLDFCPIPKSRN